VLQHLCAAALEPCLGLIGVALGTAPVLAGVKGEDLAGAALAAPEMSASAAVRQAMMSAMARRCDGGIARAMDRQVAVREAAEDVRDLDHKRCPTSEAGHHLSRRVLSEARVGSVRWV